MDRGRHARRRDGHLRERANESHAAPATIHSGISERSQEKRPEAAIRAGYSDQGNCPKVIASKLLANVEVQAEISRQLRGYCAKLEVDAELVVQGILKSIEDCKKAGTGAWQMQGIQRGYELLGRYLGIFSDRVEVGVDEKIMEQLVRGRKYAAGLAQEEESPEETDAKEESESKPN